MTAGPPHDQPGQEPSQRPQGQPGQYQPPPGYQPMQPPPPQGPAQQQWPPGQQYGSPAYPPAPQYPWPQHGTGGSTDKGFFGSLFDYGFRSFVTPKLVKIVYILATVSIGLTYLAFVVSGFRANGGIGVLVLIFGAIAAIFYLAFIRLTLELIYAVVRMSQDINQRLPSR